VSRRLDLQFDFLAHYEILQVDRIDHSGGKKAYGFPDAALLDPQQELADRPILEVRPGRGDPWVGVFHGGSYSVPVTMRGRVIGWPDEWSICVVYGGGGVVVRTDDPSNAYEIESDPTITGLMVIPERELVIFADWTNLVAYGRDGLVWRSHASARGRRLANGRPRWRRPSRSWVSLAREGCGRSPSIWRPARRAVSRSKESTGSRSECTLGARLGSRNDAGRVGEAPRIGF
jgi:hypothetical protein